MMWRRGLDDVEAGPGKDMEAAPGEPEGAALLWLLLLVWGFYAIVAIVSGRGYL